MTTDHRGRSPDMVSGGRHLVRGRGRGREGCSLALTCRHSNGVSSMHAQSLILLRCHKSSLACGISRTLERSDSKPHYHVPGGGQTCVAAEHNKPTPGEITTSSRLAASLITVPYGQNYFPMRYTLLEHVCNRAQIRQRRRRRHEPETIDIAVAWMSLERSLEHVSCST